MSRNLKAALFAFTTMSLMGIAQAASGGKFVVDESDESRVQFTSDAPLEKITGVGHKLTGNVELDPANVAATKGTIELDVASIRTNLDLRDEHLRGPDWLDAKANPKIKFAITKVEGVASLTPNQQAEVKVTGKLSMHGVTREETAVAKVRYIPEKGVKVQADFKVKLTNYKVSVPQVVRLKVSDDIGLSVMLLVKPKK